MKNWPSACYSPVKLSRVWNCAQSFQKGFFCIHIQWFKNSTEYFFCGSQTPNLRCPSIRIIMRQKETRIRQRNIRIHSPPASVVCPPDFRRLSDPVNPRVPNLFGRLMAGKNRHVSCSTQGAASNGAQLCRNMPERPFASRGFPPTPHCAGGPAGPARGHLALKNTDGFHRVRRPAFSLGGQCGVVEPAVVCGGLCDFLITILRLLS